MRDYTIPQIDEVMKLCYESGGYSGVRAVLPCISDDEISKRAKVLGLRVSEEAKRANRSRTMKANRMRDVPRHFNRDAKVYRTREQEIADRQHRIKAMREQNAAIVREAARKGGNAYGSYAGTWAGVRV